MDEWMVSAVDVVHAATRVAEAVYRKELRPVLTEGAEVIDNNFMRNKSAG